MEKMIDDDESIRAFLDSLPDIPEVLEEGIDIQTQEEYLDYSHSFDRGELGEEETVMLGRILLNPNTVMVKMTKTLFVLFLISLSFCSKVVAQEQKGIPMDALISEWSLNESELVEGYDDINDYFYYKESDENFTVFYYLNGDICTMLFIWPHYEDGVSAWADYLNSNTSVESPDESWKGVVRGVDVDISVEWAEESPYFQWIFR